MLKFKSLICILARSKKEMLFFCCERVFNGQAVSGNKKCCDALSRGVAGALITMTMPTGRALFVRSLAVQM
jgi:hypothetical protein